MTLDRIIRAAIEDALDQHGGNKVAAAKQLAIGKTTIYRLLKQWERERQKRRRRAKRRARSLKP